MDQEFLEDKFDEYVSLLEDKFNRGSLSYSLYQRLVTKLTYWYELAEKKGLV